MQYQNLIPRYPGTQVVKVVTVPSPPLLSVSDTAKDHYKLMAKAYVSTIERKMSVKTWRTPEAEFAAAREALLEKEIAPHAWCSFSTDVWVKNTGNATPPPIRWVYAPKRLTDLRWMYYEVSTAYCGGQTYVGDKHRELILRWEKMKREILFIPAADATQHVVRKVIEAIFPGDTYPTMVRAAQAEAARLQTKLDERVQRGEFSW